MKKERKEKHNDDELMISYFKKPDVGKIARKGDFFYFILEEVQLFYPSYNYILFYFLNFHVVNLI